MKSAPLAFISSTTSSFRALNFSFRRVSRVPSRRLNVVANVSFLDSGRHIDFVERVEIFHDDFSIMIK